MLGYTPEDWAASPDFFVSICHPDDLERVLTETSRLLAERWTDTDRVPPAAARWQRGLGAGRGSGRARRGRSSPCAHRATCSTSPSARSARRRCARADARTRAMLDAALDGVVMIDHDGAIVEFNPAAERIFGYGREAVVGRQMVDLIVPPAYRAAHSAGFAALPRDGREHGARQAHRGTWHASRRQRVSRSSSASRPSTSAASRSSRPTCATSASRHRREAALLESEAIVNSSFDAVVGRTIDGIVTSWNPAAERVFGYAAEEIIGRSVSMLWPPELRGELGQPQRRASALGDVVEPFEAVRVRKDGRAHPRRVDARADRRRLGRDHRRLFDRARHHRAEALPGAGRGAGGAAGVHGDGRRPATRARSPGAVRREVRRRRASPRSCCSIATDCTCATARLRVSPEFYREAIDGVAIGPNVGSCGTAAYPPRARLRLGHRERPALERLPRAGARGGSRRVLVDAHLRDGRRAARHVRPVLPRAPRVWGERRATSSSSRRIWPGSRSSARAPRRRARERGALPGPVRERERADRHRHDGRADHRGQPRVRARARLHAGRADRHEPRAST